MWHGKDFEGGDEHAREHSQDRGKCLKLGLGRLGFEDWLICIVLDTIYCLFFTQVLSSSKSLIYAFQDPFLYQKYLTFWIDCNIKFNIIDYKSSYVWRKDKYILCTTIVFTDLEIFCISTLFSYFNNFWSRLEKYFYSCFRGKGYGVRRFHWSR